MNVDLYQLRTFCVVAEEEHITRAADRLYLSAPSVSAHIKALEDEFGVALFARSPRGMTLTEAGHTLWDDAENLLRQAASLRRKAAGLNDTLSGTLRMGINNPPESLHIPALLAQLGATHPGLRFEYAYGNSRSVLTGLRQETFDIGFFESTDVPAEVAAERLEARELVLIAPQGRASELRERDTRGLQDEPWIFASEGCSLYGFARDWCAAQGLRIEPHIRSDSVDCTTVGFVARGLGLSVVARESLLASDSRDAVAILPHLSGSLPLSVGYRKDRAGDARIKAALEMIRSLFRDGSKEATVAVANPTQPNG